MLQIHFFVFPEVIFTDIKAYFEDWKTDSQVREWNHGFDSHVRFGQEVTF